MLLTKPLLFLIHSTNNERVSHLHTDIHNIKICAPTNCVAHIIDKSVDVVVIAITGPCSVVCASMECLSFPVYPSLIHTCFIHNQPVTVQKIHKTWVSSCPVTSTGKSTMCTYHLKFTKLWVFCGELSVQ